MSKQIFILERNAAGWLPPCTTVLTVGQPAPDPFCEQDRLTADGILPVAKVTTLIDKITYFSAR